MSRVPIPHPPPSSLESRGKFQGPLFPPSPFSPDHCPSAPPPPVAPRRHYTVAPIPRPKLAAWASARPLPEMALPAVNPFFPSAPLPSHTRRNKGRGCSRGANPRAAKSPPSFGSLASSGGMVGGKARKGVSHPLWIPPHHLVSGGGAPPSRLKPYHRPAEPHPIELLLNGHRPPFPSPPTGFDAPYRLLPPDDGYRLPEAESPPPTARKCSPQTMRCPVRSCEGAETVQSNIAGPNNRNENTHRTEQKSIPLTGNGSSS